MASIRKLRLRKEPSSSADEIVTATMSELVLFLLFVALVYLGSMHIIANGPPGSGKPRFEFTNHTVYFSDRNHRLFGCNVKVMEDLGEALVELLVVDEARAETEHDFRTGYVAVVHIYGSANTTPITDLYSNGFLEEADLRKLLQSGNPGGANADLSKKKVNDNLTLAYSRALRVYLNLRMNPELERLYNEGALEFRVSAVPIQMEPVGTGALQDDENLPPCARNSSFPPTGEDALQRSAFVEVNYRSK